MGINAEKWEKKESVVILTSEEYSVLLCRLNEIMNYAVSNMTMAAIADNRNADSRNADDVSLFTIKETSRNQIESIARVLDTLCKG